MKERVHRYSGNELLSVLWPLMVVVPFLHTVLAYKNLYSSLAVYYNNITTIWWSVTVAISVKLSTTHHFMLSVIYTALVIIKHSTVVRLSPRPVTITIYAMTHEFIFKAHCYVWISFTSLLLFMTIFMVTWRNTYNAFHWLVVIYVLNHYCSYFSFPPQVHFQISTF